MKKYLMYFLSVVLLSAGSPTVYAQTWKKAARRAAGHFTHTDLTGIWKYEGVAVEFKSDNLLKKAGGAVAASTVKKSVNEQLSKVGFEPGITTFTFKADSTFIQTTGTRSLTGTYSLDQRQGTLSLKYLNHVPVTSTLSGGSGKISLLFDASGLLSVVSFLGSHSGNSALGALTSIVNSYDGMLVGLELRKK